MLQTVVSNCPSSVLAISRSKSEIWTLFQVFFIKSIPSDTPLSRECASLIFPSKYTLSEHKDYLDRFSELHMIDDVSKGCVL